MFDISTTHDEVGRIKVAKPTKFFFVTKRIFDVCFSLLLVPVLLCVSIILIVLNPFFNKGPLLFSQERMGRDCKPFTALKFRSMLEDPMSVRGCADPVEHHRITKLGRVLRKLRLDELPQIINVLKGDMSLIGPRPDYLPHAREFLYSVPGYRARHEVRPGISGLAQTEVGYAQGPHETRRKVTADLYYIKNAGFRLEAWIFWRTLCTIFGWKGV